MYTFEFVDTNDALHYYKSVNARTTNGVLNITTNFAKNDFLALNEKTKKKYGKTKYIQSAMLQGWNKFCFTGGIIEISAKLPGKSKVGGLWPACKFCTSPYLVFPDCSLFITMLYNH